MFQNYLAGRKVDPSGTIIFQHQIRQKVKSNIIKDLKSAVLHIYDKIPLFRL